MQLGLGNLVVIKGADITCLGICVEGLRIRGLNDRAHSYLISPVGKVKVFLGRPSSRLCGFDPLLRTDHIQITLLYFQSNLLFPILLLSLDRIVVVQCLLNPVGGLETVKDRYVQAELHLPAWLQRKGVYPTVAGMSPAIIRIKNNIGEVPSSGSRNLLILRLPLGLEALELRTGIEGSLLGLFEREGGSCDRAILGYRLLRKIV